MKHFYLRKELERELGIELRTPKDFKLLSERIESKTHEYISIDTLMRIWGYKESVTTRTSTLNILAQFLGYDNYSSFCRAFPNETAEDKESNKNSSTCKSEDTTKEPMEPQKNSNCMVKYRKWLIAAAYTLGIALLTGGYVYFNTKAPEQHSEPTAPVNKDFLTSLDQISNDRQYYIHTRNDKRGLLGVNDNMPTTTFKAAVDYRCDSASTFALLKYDDYYYIYSVQDKRYINVLLMETDKPLLAYYAEKDWCACDLHMRDSFFVFDFWADHAANKVFTLNVNKGNGLIITDYGTMTDMWDDGNLFCIEDAGHFDPTEALSMFGKKE